MNIDLSGLYSRVLKEITINENITIPSEYFKSSGILGLKNIKASGRFFLDSDDEVAYEFNINGIMIINDSVSFEEVEYEFNSDFDGKIEENLKNIQNTIDIIPILWENIVLEVPLRFTKVNDVSNIHGDGWKLITEEELNQRNNPFNDLGKE